MAAFVRGLSDAFGVTELIFFRMVFTAIVAAIGAYFAHISLKTRYLSAHFVRALLAMMTLSLWFYALQNMDFGACQALAYTTPLFLAFGALVLAAFGKTKASWSLTFVIIIGFIGILLVMQPEFRATELKPALASLVSAILSAAVYVQLKHLGNLGEPSTRIVFYYSTFATIAFGLLWLINPEPRCVLTTESFSGLIGICACAALGQYALTKAYSEGHVLLSSCLSYTTIPISLLIGFSIFEDAMTLLAVIGSLLIVLTSVAATVLTKKDSD